MWTEVRLSDGTWIPVDPSTKLVGDTPEGLAMFEQANYITSGGLGIDQDYSPNEVTPNPSRLIFRPAQSTTEAKYGLLLASTRPIYVISAPNIPPTNKPFTGNAALVVKATQMWGMMNLEIAGAK